MRGTCANYLVPDARRLLARRFPAVIITFDLTTVGSTGQYEGFSTLDGNSGATWSLVGVNDAFTQFAVNGGTIAFDSQQALGILTDLSLGGGTLSFAQDATLSGSVVTTLADDTRSTVSVASNKTLTVDGTLIGAGALSIVGGGSVVLAGSSANFVGSVRLSDATLDMGAGSGFRVATGQSLAIGGWRGDAAQAAGTLQASVVLLDGTSNWDGTRSSLVFNHTDSNYTFTSSLAGHGEVRHLSGTTTLMASAQGGFDGYTWIDGGTLKLGASQALGSDLLSVASGATFDMNGYALTIDRLRGGATSF